MNKFNINRMNAILSWLSIFGISWLLILGLIPSTTLNWCFFAFFFIVAWLAASSEVDRQKKTQIQRE